MKITWKNRKVALITVTACVGLAAAGFVSTALTFSPSLWPSSDAQSAKSTEHATAGEFPSNLFPAATAAVPIKSMHESLAPYIEGGDSRLDDYRLERDSCCIGN